MSYAKYNGLSNTHERQQHGGNSNYLNIHRSVCNGYSGQYLIHGAYIGIGRVSELSETECNESISLSFNNSVLISTFIDDDKRFFEVSCSPEVYTSRHNLVPDHVYAQWLAVIALYHIENRPKSPLHESDHLKIQYNLTYFPVWLLRQQKDFGLSLDNMADRFRGQHQVTVLTPGYERELTVTVDSSECRIEGETARWAMKYDLGVNPRDDAQRFDRSYGVLTEICADAQAMIKLPPGLGTPTGVADYQSYTETSWLQLLDQLLKTDLTGCFESVSELHHFIIDNIQRRRYEMNGVDLTSIIEPALKRFVSEVMSVAIGTFAFLPNDEVTMVWIGEVTEMLRPYMMEFLQETFSQAILEQYHYFPSDADKLTLYGGEIVAKSRLYTERWEAD